MWHFGDNGVEGMKFAELPCKILPEPLDNFLTFVIINVDTVYQNGRCPIRNSWRKRKWVRKVLQY